jgi:hypothetical protein
MVFFASGRDQPVLLIYMIGYALQLSPASAAEPHHVLLKRGRVQPLFAAKKNAFLLV